MILVDACLGADDSAGRQKDLYWFGLLGGVKPYVQFVLLVYLALVCGRGLQTVERGTASQVSEIGEKLECSWPSSG